MKRTQLVPMKLQMFAEPGEGDNPDTTLPGAGQTPSFNMDDLTDEQLSAIKEKHGLKTDDDVDSIIKSKHQRWQKDFEKEKAEFRKEQLFLEKGKQLVSEGLPSEFASRITGETAEDILADVKAFRAEWDKAVEAKVNERLASKTKTKVGSSGGQMTKAEIISVKDSVERQQLIAQNRDLF